MLRVFTVLALASASTACFHDSPPSFATETGTGALTSTGVTSTGVTSTGTSSTSTTGGSSSSTGAPTSSGTSAVDPTGASSSSGSGGSPPDMGGGEVACPAVPELVACYLFDDGDVATLTDGSTGGWHGTMKGVTLIPGPRGTAIATKVDSLVAVSSTSGPKGGPIFTAMAWARIDEYTPLRAGVLNRDTDYGIFIEPDGQPLCSGGGQNHVGVEPIPLGVWTHLACVRGGGTSIIYVDGVAVSMKMFNFPEAPVTSRLVIANDSPPSAEEALRGAVDEVLLWSAALTPAQICEYAALPCQGGL